MRDSSAPERPRLAGSGSFLVLVGVVGCALALLLPETEQVLAGPGRTLGVDAVALAYLRAALTARPDDAALRLRLARGQQELSRQEEALATLAPLLPREGEAGREARLLAFGGALERWRQAPLPEETMALGMRLASLLEEPHPPEAREELMRAALEVRRPDLAAGAAEALAEAEPGRRVEWLGEAGRQWLASGEPERAAEALARAAESAAEEEGAALAFRALETARGLREAPVALALVERLLGRFPGRAALLDGAVALALSHGALAEANRWSEERVLETPEDEEGWRRRREVALAVGELGGAIEACRRLVRLRPDAIAEWEWLARVAGWAGARDTELEAWHWLIVHVGAPVPVGRAVRLARALGDTRRLVEVLVARERRAGLVDEELSLLVDTYEYLGFPERAEELLRGRPGVPWLRRLARVREAQGRLSEALATWEELEAAGEAPVEALRVQGELLWRMWRPREALERLRGGRERAGPEALDYWRLLAGLAWSLDADEDALVAHRVLWRHAPEEPLVGRRLARLCTDAGRVAEGEGRLEEARARYGEALAVDGRDVTARLGLLRVEEAAGAHGALATLLAEWEEEAEREPAYFAPYARAFQRLGRKAEAAAWYGRYARSRPDDGHAHLAHAQALDEAGQRAAADTAWRAALERLRPEVETALTRLPAPEAVEKVLWGVRMEERLGGPSAGWREALFSRAGASAAVQDQALARAVAREEWEEVRHWLGRMRSSGRTPPAWVVMRVGLEDGDAPSIQALLEERGAELALTDRIAAERWLGHHARARALLATEPRAGLSAAQRRALAVHARELSARLEPRLRLLTGRERLGGLEISSFEAEGRAPGPGESLLRVRGTHRLTEAGSLGVEARETGLSLGATFGPERLATDVELSLWGAWSGLRPAARVRQRVVPATGPRLEGEAAWGEVADESERARLFGLRHRLSGTLALGLGVAGELSATADARWYRTHGLERLGEGVLGSLQWVRPWSGAGLEGHVRLSGVLARRWFQRELPEEMEGLLPERTGQVGLGLRVGQERGPGGLDWSAEVWSGWLWPERLVGYQLQLEAGLPIPRAGALKLRLAQGNALQGVEGAWRSVVLGWEYSFGGSEEGHP